MLNLRPSTQVALNVASLVRELSSDTYSISRSPIITLTSKKNSVRTLTLARLSRVCRTFHDAGLDMLCS